MRYSARLAGILKQQVAIFPITAIHFTWPPEQPGMTSRVIKNVIKILCLTCNWTIDGIETIWDVNLTSIEDRVWFRLCRDSLD